MQNKTKELMKTPPKKRHYKTKKDAYLYVPTPETKKMLDYAEKAGMTKKELIDLALQAYKGKV